MHNHFWLRPRVSLPVSKVASNSADVACVKEEELLVVYLQGVVFFSPYEETTFGNSSAVNSGLWFVLWKWGFSKLMEKNWGQF